MLRDFLGSSIGSDRVKSALLLLRLQLFKQKLEGRFEIKSHILGVSPEEESEGRILNRIIRVGYQGWHYEADQRYAQIPIEDMKMTETNALQIPSEGRKEWEV